MPKLFDLHKDKVRFLIAGAWNTIFGYFIFLFLYYAFSKYVHYMFLLILSNILSITNAYISYKLFVFKTKGNIIKEYLRFYVVYAASIAGNLILLPIFVELLHIHPAVSQAIIIMLMVSVSYFGHKHFSFAIR